MLDTIGLGKFAAELHKESKTTRGRSGRRVKGEAMQKHLHAAGQPKMNTPGVFAFARGRKA